MSGYTPHTDADVASMLAFLGLDSVDDLFAVVPAALRLAGGLDLAPGAPEPDVYARLEDLAAGNRPVGRDLVCFAGGGAYDHEVPAVTRALASRSEFVTSYTPYQPEVAQGVLQAVFEFQTLVARLSGLAIANASLYDGAASLVEAVNLAVGATGRPDVLVSHGVNPSWREVLATFAAGTGHRIHDVALATASPTGARRCSTISTSPGPSSSPTPTTWAVSRTSPRRAPCATAPGRCSWWPSTRCAPGILRAPGGLGRRRRGGGGPGPRHAALLRRALSRACSRARPTHVRRLPGRLVGETVDAEERRAYVTTLRAREQDIRREKATSNVCTNQTLMAVTAAIQLGWLGTSGLAEIALRSRPRRPATVATPCCRSPASTPLATAPVVREFALHVPIDAAMAVERMADEGFLAGIALDPSYADGRADGLLVAVTERRTRAEIDAFVATFEKALR